MIYELRTYSLVMGAVPEYLEVAKTKLLPVMAEHGLKTLAFWSTETGPLNEVLHLWAYEDLNERQTKWRAWGRDPRRSELVPKLRQLIVAQSNKILSPADFSPMK